MALKRIHIGLWNAHRTSIDDQLDGFVFYWLKNKMRMYVFYPVGDLNRECKSGITGDLIQASR